MFEGAVAGILNRLLGKYVQDLDTENLNVGIFSGNVNLTDLKLKPEALYELDLPIDVKIGTIGRISLQIPWTGLYTQPVIVNIDDVLLLVGPAISNSYFDPEREKRLTRAAKRKILQDLEAESEILKGPQNFFENLFTAIVNNIQIYVRNIHVRYEDSISSKDGPLACGLCLQSLSIETTNSKWKPAVTPASASTVYQLMRVESLSAYWNPSATALDDAETAHITPMQYYNWKHYMLTGLDKFSMHREDFEFLVKPVTCKVKVLINRSGEARVPRLLLDAVVHDSALQLSRRQYLSIDNLLTSFNRIKLTRKYRHLHPGVPLSKDIKKWWRYAYNVVVEQRVRPYSWAAIKKHRENYNIYKKTYKSTLRSPNDTELKLDLQKCEDSLPIISVVIAREQAKFELLNQEPERIEVVETEVEWWKPASSPCEGADERSRVELCVRTERSRTLWSHLTSPEKSRLCELIGYVDGEPRHDRTKQFIEHKINLTLANCSLTLINRGKEILVVTLTQFLSSLETRPSAKAYKVSARAEQLAVEGVSAGGALVSVAAGARGAAPAPGSLLALDLERRPAAGDADYALTCLMEPMDLLYEQHAFTELINFVATRSARPPGGCSAGRARAAARGLASLAASRRKVFHVTMDLKGPCLMLPENGCMHKSARLLVLDVGRVLVRSELQPELALEDATCMELEERLYDRLHAECEAQVLFCGWGSSWRESRRHADSELHLVPRVKVQVVFSNSIKKDYKLLPRYKLNISLSSFKLNLSDLIISQLLDFADSLPMPVATTVPVSDVDSGDYPDDEEDPMEMVLDRIRHDPGYADLVKLRQKIVAAYLSRNKCAPTAAEADSVSCGHSASADLSDEDAEIFARTVDLPGFEDNVSPSNTINTLLRFIVGEIVVNMSRTVEEAPRPYLLLRLGRVCVEVALLQFGPALQLALGAALLADKHHTSAHGEYLELLASSGDLLNLIYRKVRCDCPEFRSAFHSVEHALVLDAAPLALTLHAQALTELHLFLQQLYNKVQSRCSVSLKKAVTEKARGWWERLAEPERDPPVPPGATKFSYSVRLSSVSFRLEAGGFPLALARLGALELDRVLRAGPSQLLRASLGDLHVDELAGPTLYPKLIWPDEDKVLEVKYVENAPVVGAAGAGAPVRAQGELRLRVGRLHVVFLSRVLLHLQPLAELCAPAVQRAAAAARAAAARAKRAATRINLVIDIHAPVLLLPQKPSSPNLLVWNMGDLTIENFFKQTNQSQDASSPVPSPIIDNILVKLVNVTVSRAVMTLAGTLEVQEPILEPVTIRLDLKRLVGWAGPGAALAASGSADCVVLNVGQRDLATALAVWADNLAEGWDMGNMVPSSPVEVPASDASVKKLQAFLSQGDAARKEITFSFTVEGVELKLFSDLDEVLSSPVREASQALARLAAGELALALDRFADGSCELRASLQSLLLEDIRHVAGQVTTRIVESPAGAAGAAGAAGISVRRPALLEAAARAAGPRGTHADVRVDPVRLNLALPFLLQLARTLLDAMPGEKTLEGGVVNHGYVCEGGAPRTPARLHSTSDSTSGYYSTSASVSEEAPGLSISVQFRQPEVLLFTEKAGHALLLRAELLVDYSHHAGCESLVLALAGLQIMSKLQSKLKSLPPQPVLRPCDVEVSRVVRSAEEGVKIKVSVSEIDLHLAATTVHTCTDIMDEIASELSFPEEREVFRFSLYESRGERGDEELWAPRRAAAPPAPAPAAPPAPARPASFDMGLPLLRVILELEHAARVPVIMFKVSGWVWVAGARGGGAARAAAAAYNQRAGRWEPLLEPRVARENTFAPWELTLDVIQMKAYPMISNLNTPKPDTEAETSTASEHSKKPKKRSGFESETSADECDTDNEMTFIRNPKGRESRGFSEYGRSMAFLGNIDIDESDSENENGLMNKLATAIGHLFTDDSSGDESNSESSAPQSEAEGENDKVVTFTDDDRKEDHKTVTLQEPARAPSPPLFCPAVIVRAPHPLNITLGAGAVHAICALHAALTDRSAAVSQIVTASDAIQLINDIGPGSTVTLRTRGADGPDGAGEPRVLAVADYDVDTSRPSTPGCDTSSADMLDDEECKPKQETDSEEWDCSAMGAWSGGAGECGGAGAGAGAGAGGSPAGPAAPRALRARLTHHTLLLQLTDLQPLTIVCPQRTVSKLHVLPPSAGGTRYYVVVDRTCDYNDNKIVLRSPYQLRNETSYALEVLYHRKELQAAGAALLGSLANPFDGRLRLAVLAPHQTYNVPLHVAYHCKLYLQPFNFEGYQTASQGIWWMELANDLGVPREIICPAKLDVDKSVFAMRVVASEGVQSHKVSRAIPNYLVRILPPLAIYNRLPYAIELSCNPRGWRARLEAGERVAVHAVLPRDELALSRPQPHQWASLLYSHELNEKVLTLSGDNECGVPGQMCATVVRGDSAQLHLHAHYWVINKTGLPLQMKSRQSESIYSLSAEPLAWCGGARARVSFRAHHSGWSRAARAAPAAPGLVVCHHSERRHSYRFLMTVTLSELCPQLTKIMTLLPYFVVYNDTKKHLRYMEENEAADLWMDLSPAQCVPFWPQTDSMSMHVKYRDSALVSHRFPIANNHTTVLRMDKGSAIVVEVTGGTERPFTITFKPYSPGDAPVRVDNLCDDLFLKLHQAGSGQVALLSPFQCLLYTWDDPAKERTLMWNIYNNKGKGFVADFGQDGYGEEKVSFHSVKHTTLVATSSVTSKLSSTLKRLTPKSPEPCSSSSDDSDSGDAPDPHTKSKKMRKDKVIVYWVSYMDGHQRVFALAQDERIAQQYRQIINPERSSYEVYLSLASVSLSVCIQNSNSIKELAYISVTDTLPRWEVMVNHKWKQLTPDLTDWIEDKYQTEQKKCQLKDYLHIDLEKMQMTKPFFAELKRTYNPGVWMQLRKSETLTYLDLKLQRFQIDNQLPEAVFPCVLYPAAPPADLKSSEPKPCIEIVTLKQYRPALCQEVYKYVKVLVQEYNVNLDRGFVNYVFDILNHWKIEEKPAVRLRADLALVHMPLPIIALKSQIPDQRNVYFEHVHLSPIKLVLSLSSRGCIADNPTSPYRSKFGNKKENRPKIFNSDLLEYLFNSWGSSLCDMKDVVFKMSYLELRNAPLTISGLMDAASRHYWTQLIQQFYVLVLGMNILGNPYSYIGDFNRAMKQYYEPHLGTAVGRWSLQLSRSLMAAAGALAGLRAGPAAEPALLPAGPLAPARATGESWRGDDLPESVVAADRRAASSLALALAALVARPTFDMCLSAGGGGAARALRLAAAAPAARRRMPRHAHITEGVRTYSVHGALGAALWAGVGRRGAYLAHAFLPPAHTQAVLLSTQHLYMVRAGGGGSWLVEWAVKLDDLIDTPKAEGDKLIIHIKQDELVNYYSTDEKIIEIPDPELLKWLQAKIECGLILALEDKRCLQE